MSNKIEFENGSIIESIDNIGKTIRGKIRDTYIDAEENKPFFEGYRPNYYFMTEPEELTESQIKDILSKAILTGIEIGSKFALDILLKHIPTTKETKEISFINGISVSIVEGTDLKFNQMKLKYSDGSSKVMDVFNWEEK